MTSLIHCEICGEFRGLRGEKQVKFAVRNQCKIIFVSGKGGVGKSTAALVLAYKWSQAGKKTLLIELGDQSYYKNLLKLSLVSSRPSPSGHGFDVALWSGQSCLREYALHILKSEKLYELFFENKASLSLIQVAPGLNELALLGKITSPLRSVGPGLDYQVLVVDAFSTGHFLSLLRAPKALAQSVRFGPIHDQCAQIHDVLCNSHLVEYDLVSICEELPMQEVSELWQTLKLEFKAQPHLIMNKIFKTDLISEEIPDSSEVGDFLRYLKVALSRQEKMLELAKSIDSERILFPLSCEGEVLSLMKELSGVVNVN